MPIFFRPGRELFSLLVAVLTSLGLVTQLGACSAAQQTSSSVSFAPTPTPSPSDGAVTMPTPSVGTTPAPTGISNLSITTDLPSIVYYTLHEASDWTKPCQVDVNPATTTAKDISCVLEIEELDLYFQSFNLNWSIPTNSCAYVAVHPYWFMQYEPGTGPTAISYTVQSDGSITGYTDPTNTSSISPDGKVTCNYDYSGRADPGPNCCEGQYVATVTTITTSGSTVSSQRGNWGGAYGNCAAGPASQNSWPRTKGSKMPMTKIYSSYLGANDVVKVDSPISLGFLTNLVSANSINSGSSLAAALTPWGSRYHEFYCLDAASESLGRIRLSVREWNRASELAEGATGDPDTGGMETDIPGYINDYVDWEDVTDSTSGPFFDGYPEEYL